jgi:hypothetical protein
MHDPDRPKNMNLLNKLLHVFTKPIRQINNGSIESLLN